MLKLSHNKPFSSGGNRVCYRHPQAPDRCLKILRPDRSPEARRREKRFPANFRPLSYFDENITEMAVLRHLHQNFPEAIRRHLPESFGMVETDLGPAHATSLITDADGRISQTLEQYIWENGLDEVATRSIDSFKQNWSTSPPNTRDLIPHNLVFQRDNEHQQVFLIDGLGRKPSFSRRGKASPTRCKRRMADLDARIARLLHRKQTNTGPTERLNNLIRE